MPMKPPKPPRYGRLAKHQRAEQNRRTMRVATIDTNGLDLTKAERSAVNRMAKRLRAKQASLYRTSEGLHAYVRDDGGGEHLGVRIVSH